MTIAYRPAEPDDAQFIVSTWSRAYKKSRSAGIISSEDWPTVMHAQIAKLLQRPEMRVMVAYENTDPTFLYGFIAADALGGYLVANDRGELSIDPAPVVFFCYVKEPYRKAGYARGMFAAIGIDPKRRFLYPCWTPVIQKVAGKIPLAKNDPNVARYPKNRS